MNRKHVLLTLAGLTAGVAIGFLLVPGNGRQVRSKLRYASGKIKEALGCRPRFSNSEMEMDATSGRRFGV